MRTAFILVVLCAFGCSQAERPTPVDAFPVQSAGLVTVTDLVYADPASTTTQHPLVCGAGRDFPTGRELAFRNPESREFVHAVFPEGVTPPEKIDGKLVLRGRYQAIQNRKSYTLKQPPQDYQYFVVSSWEYSK